MHPCVRTGVRGVNMRGTSAVKPPEGTRGATTHFQQHTTLREQHHQALMQRSLADFQVAPAATYTYPRELPAANTAEFAMQHGLQKPNHRPGDAGAQQSSCVSVVWRSCAHFTSKHRTTVQKKTGDAAWWKSQQQRSTTAGYWPHDNQCPTQQYVRGLSIGVRHT